MRIDRLLELEKTKSRMFPEQLCVLSWKKFRKKKESIMSEDDGDNTPVAERPKLPDDHDILGRL